MKFLSLFTLALLITTISSAQDYSSVVQQSQVNTGTFSTFSSVNTTIEGHPFAHNMWVKGTFRTVNNNDYKDVEMKFEAVNGLLLIRLDAGTAAADPNVVREFHYNFDSRDYTFRNGYDNPSLGISPEDYLMVLYKGENTVYKQFRKVFKKSDFNVMLNIGDRHDSFQDQSRYFVERPNGEWVSFNATRRGLNRLFPGNRRAIASYIRINYLDLNVDGDLAQIIEYLEKKPD